MMSSESKPSNKSHGRLNVFMGRKQDAVGAPCELRTSPRLAAWRKELLEGMHIFSLGIYVS